VVRQQFGWSQERVIRELRKRARLSGEDLGSAASLKTQVSRHENGQVEPGPEWRRLYRLVYGCTDVELGFGVAEETDPREELAARLAAAQGLSASDVRIMRQQVDQIRTLDRQLGAPAVLEQLRALMTTMREFLACSLRPGVREGLAAALADAAALAGWQALDVGSISKAWDHFETAKVAARESLSPALLAHAMGEQAFALLDLGEGAEAVDLVRAARALVDHGGPRLLTAWLHAAEAEAHSVSGNDMDCRQALDAAAVALPADMADPALPFIFLSESHLARWRGNCLARLGDASGIEDSLAALTGMDASFTRAEAGLRCDLAQAMTIRGELDEALIHARLARQLAIRVGSVRHRRRVERLVSLASGGVGLGPTAW
jgi:transcriptional regulator with XRE-family HTH domain